MIRLELDGLCRSGISNRAERREVLNVVHLAAARIRKAGYQGAVVGAVRCGTGKLSSGVFVTGRT